MRSLIRRYSPLKAVSSFIQGIGKSGLSAGLSPIYYSRGYTFNLINFTAFLISLFRLFLLIVFSQQNITPQALVINALPLFCCTVMMGSMHARRYLSTIYVSFLVLPFVLFFIVYHEHDRGVITFFIPYLVYPVYFLRRPWKIIALFLLAAFLLIASFGVETFHEHAAGSHRHNVAIELFGFTGAMSLCFILLYFIHSSLVTTK